MRVGRTLAAFVVTSCIAQAAWAGPTMVDVFDHPLQPLFLRNQPKLILYANQSNGHALNDPAALIARRLKDIPYVTVVRIDLRGMPHFLLGIARRFMQSSQKDGNEQYTELARAAGLKTPESMDRIHVVLDADGAAHQLLGLAQGFKQAVAVVLDRAGHEVMRVPFPEDADLVEKALRSAAQPAQVSQASQAQSTSN